MAVVGGPIAFETFNPSDQPIEWLLSATVGSLVVVAIVVVRIFLGWAYVSDRLLSATYPYEETGWYDGQTFVKPPGKLKCTLLDHDKDSTYITSYHLVFRGADP